MIEKLKTVIDNLLKNSKIPGAYVGVIRGMVDNYLKKADEIEIRAYIIDIRDNLIPWLLK